MNLEPGVLNQFCSGVFWRIERPERGFLENEGEPDSRKVAQVAMHMTGCCTRVPHNWPNPSSVCLVGALKNVILASTATCAALRRFS